MTAYLSFLILFSLFFFLSVYMFHLNPFPSSERIFFRVSYTTLLLVVDSVKFTLSKNCYFTLIFGLFFFCT